MQLNLRAGGGKLVVVRLYELPLSATNSHELDRDGHWRSADNPPCFSVPGEDVALFGRFHC